MMNVLFSWCILPMISFLAGPDMDMSGESGGRDWSRAGEVISLAEARQYTRDFTFSVDGVNAHVFEKTKLNEVLSQKDCRGVRFYHGRTEANKPVLVAAGVASDGKDIRDGVMISSEVNQSLTYEDARAMTKGFATEVNGVMGHLFEAVKVSGLLSQEGAAGLNVHHGLSQERKHVLVLFGANSDGKDMVDGTILERNFPCPPDCGLDGTVVSK